MPPLDLEERRRLWWSAALEGIARDLEAEAVEGNRNNALRDAACRLGDLLHLAGWTPAEGENWLWGKAAHLVDKTFLQSEARRTIREGIRKGAMKPQDWPADLQGTGSPGRKWRARTPKPPEPAKPEPPPNYPPAGEVAALWDACLPVDGGAEAALSWDHDPLAWCLDLGFDPELLALHDLCRMIPDGLTPPAWATLGRRTWPQAGFRLVIRAWTAAGDLASLHARFTRAGKPPERTPKTLWPAGFDCKGLVFTNAAALAILRGETREACPVVVVEGLTDWLPWGAAPVAVFGVTAGAWTPALAAKIPDGSTLIVRTDNDPAGDKYAAKIKETFTGRRVELRRQTPKEKT